MENSLTRIMKMETIIPVLSKYTNGYAFIHGEALIQYADNFTFTLTSSFSKNNLLTAKINNIEILNPIKINDIIKFKAKVVKTEKSSIFNNVKVSTEEIKTGKIFEIFDMNFFMIIDDENLKHIKILDKGN